MSRLDSDRGRGIAGPKPKPDVYTVLLGIACGAIVCAIIFLLIEMSRYEFQWKPAQAPLPAPTALAARSALASLEVDAMTVPRGQYKAPRTIQGAPRTIQVSRTRLAVCRPLRDETAAA